MKYTQILASCAAAAALATAHMACNGANNGSDHPDGERAATPHAPDPQVATTVGQGLRNPALAQAGGVETQPKPDPETPGHGTPRQAGVYSATLAPYSDDLLQMLAAMRRISTTQQAVAYEQEFRADLPRLSTTVTNYLTGLRAVGFAIQSGSRAPEVIQAQATLNTLETIGAATDAEMVRIEALHPGIRAVFEQYRELHLQDFRPSTDKTTDETIPHNPL